MLSLTVILFLWMLYVVCISQRQNAEGFSVGNTKPIRGLLAWLIVMNHISLWLTYGIPPLSWNARPTSISNFISEFQCYGYLVVSVFFFISGYGLIKSLINKGQEYVNTFASKRFPRMIVPFVICILTFILLDDLLFDERISILRLDSWRGNCPLLPTSWYVIVIILFYGIFYVFARTLHSPLLVTFAMWCFIFSYMAIMAYTGFREYWWMTTGCIGIGMTIGLYEEKILHFVSVKYKLLCEALFLIWLLFYHINIDYLPQCDTGIIPLLAIARSGVFAVIVWFYVSCTGFFHNKLLNLMGNISYEIYLVQGMVILFCSRLSSGYAVHTIPLLFLIFAVTSIFAVIVNKSSRMMLRK
ncbi:MAG: acyltransferase [Prevotella sp.]|nr:acyltransferase [Prevotella sp.]